MVKAINDDEIKLRKRARRRLIGAIALVLLAILILPLVLDHEPASLAPDLAVVTSNGKSDFTSRVVPVPPSAPSVAPGEKPAPMPAPPVADKPVVAASPIESKPIDEQQSEKGELPAAAASKKEAGTTKAEKSAEVRKSAARAADTKPKKTPAATAEAKVQRSDTFAIQLESFANAANARQLQEKLAENGVKSYTEVVETRQGKRTRVRVGPFATHEAAEQALSKLKASGFSGIVNP